MILKLIPAGWLQEGWQMPDDDRVIRITLSHPYTHWAIECDRRISTVGTKPVRYRQVTLTAALNQHVWATTYDDRDTHDDADADAASQPSRQSDGAGIDGIISITERLHQTGLL